ncbi:MAG: hypothetical protein QME32_02770, partial [Endomicrobiia bacterium]|nr:hypothetical protein [Endomicrobiia bacterium]
RVSSADRAIAALAERLSRLSGDDLAAEPVAADAASRLSFALDAYIEDICGAKKNAFGKTISKSAQTRRGEYRQNSKNPDPCGTSTR